MSGEWKRTAVSDDQLNYIKKAFQPPSKKEVAEKCGITIYILDRILDELGMNVTWSFQGESKEHKKKRIKCLYENTELPMVKLVESLNLHYEEVLVLLHEMYTDEQIKARSARMYSRSKSGDNNPLVMQKKLTGHGPTYKGGKPCDDGNGYNLVPNDGVLDKSNNKSYHKDSGDQTWVFEHQKVFLPAIGLNKMPDNFVIHHIDGNKKNNSLDNLCLLTRSAHLRLHKLLDEVENK